MARKKPPEEHENLERWMVSYADFLTLLFATFVVLYALSQINLEQFKELQLSIKKAFTAPSIMQGDVGVMNQGQNIIDNSNANAMIDSLMLEYVSPTYEQESFEEIKEDIEALNKTGELDGVNATIDKRGIVINMNDDGILFKSGSADLSNAARKKLDLIRKADYPKICNAPDKNRRTFGQNPLHGQISIKLGAFFRTCIINRKISHRQI